jgi:hypothetical protein
MSGTKNLFIILLELLIWFIDRLILTHFALKMEDHYQRLGLRTARSGGFKRASKKARPLSFGN